MHARSEAFDLQKALLNPAAVFGAPKAVVEDERLSREQKLQLLKQWEHDALSLAVAEGEGMAGGEESMLNRVRLAIDRVKRGAPRAQPAQGSRTG
jgi:hypothetical protein